MTNFGTVKEQCQYKNKVYFICEYNGIYSLIEHDMVYNITNPILRCSDCDYVSFKLREELKK